MTITDIIFFLIGAISGYISGIYLLLEGIKYRNARTILIFVSALVLWYAVLYTLVLLKIVPFVGYGVYARPIVFALFLSPSLIWRILKNGWWR